MSVKRAWDGTVERVVAALRHRYKDGESAELVSVSCEVRFELRADDGTGKGRKVVLWLTPDAADSLSKHLTMGATEARTENERAGWVSPDA